MKSADLINAAEPRARHVLAFTRSLDEILASTGTDPERGLSDSQVVNLRERYGPNRLKEAPPTPVWIKLLAQFKDLVIWILIVADLVSGLLGALWEDIKFDLKHFKDIDRLAMVGDRTWEKCMSTFCGPFTSADIRYFNQSESEETRQWINEELPVSTL